MLGAQLVQACRRVVLFGLEFQPGEQAQHIFLRRFAIEVLFKHLHCFVGLSDQQPQAGQNVRGQLLLRFGFERFFRQLGRTRIHFSLQPGIGQLGHQLGVIGIGGESILQFGQAFLDRRSTARQPSRDLFDVGYVLSLELFLLDAERTLRGAARESRLSR